MKRFVAVAIVLLASLAVKAGNQKLTLDIGKVLVAQNETSCSDMSGQCFYNITYTFLNGYSEVLGSFFVPNIGEKELSLANNKKLSVSDWSKLENLIQTCPTPFQFNINGTKLENISCSFSF